MPRINVKCNSFAIFLFFYTQFDYLKSLEIEEKINKIKWCQTANGALFLLSTNDKTIKFWKVWREQLNILVENTSLATCCINF